MKMSTKYIHQIFLVATLVLNVNLVHAKELQDYVPVLDAVITKAFQVDPKIGYLVKKVKPNVYVITDGVWQSAFVTTGNGVVLLDAPESFGKHIIKAVADVSDEPIKILIYSHSHVDHIAGSKHLKDIKNLRIIAHENIVKYLATKKASRQLMPTETYKGNHVVRLGSEIIKLDHNGNYHSTESDAFIYLPKSKFLMVVDSLAPGYVPFMAFDLTHNFHEYLKVFDTILTYDFDVFVGGHLTQLGTKSDVRLTRSYVKDVYKTVKRIHKETNLFKIMSATAKTIGWDNKYLLFKEFLDHIVEKSAKEIEQRWTKKLAGVDVWAESHARTALIYVRWDD